VRIWLVSGGPSRACAGAHPHASRPPDWRGSPARDDAAAPLKLVTGRQCHDRLRPVSRRNRRPIARVAELAPLLASPGAQDRSPPPPPPPGHECVDRNNWMCRRRCRDGSAPPPPAPAHNAVRSLETNPASGNPDPTLCRNGCCHATASGRAAHKARRRLERRLAPLLMKTAAQQFSSSATKHTLTSRVTSRRGLRWRSVADAATLVAVDTNRRRAISRQSYDDNDGTPASPLRLSRQQNKTISCDRDTDRGWCD
jgi:hypothetical protein